MAKLQHIMRFSAMEQFFGRTGGDPALLVAKLRAEGFPVQADPDGQVRATHGRFSWQDHVNGAQTRTFYWEGSLPGVPDHSSEQIIPYHTPSRRRQSITDPDPNETFRQRAIQRDAERDRARRRSQMEEEIADLQSRAAAEDPGDFNYEREQRKIEVAIRKPRAIELERE